MREFRVYMEDDDPGDARRIEATDAETAAEEFVQLQEQFNCDYPVASGRDTAVVIVLDGDTRSTWRVSGETIPYYSAWPCAVKPDDTIDPGPAYPDEWGDDTDGEEVER